MKFIPLRRLGVYIASGILLIGLNCNPQAKAAPPTPTSTNVEVIAQTTAADYFVILVAVHDDKRGVTCYISYPGDQQMSCLPDVWISGKVAPAPSAVPQ